MKKALGIRAITFRSYKGNNRWLWDVVMEDGSSFRVSVPNLATESTILRAAAKKLATMDHAVRWPQ